MSRFNVAIDGPAGAGKSTVARIVAGKLGFVYVDTGAMYRAVTWKILSQGITPLDTDRVIAAARRLEIILRPGDNGQQVFADGMDLTGLIRSGEINQNVSQIASIRKVRELLVEKQKQLAAGKGVVMDGRDIGTHVLPDAEVKIFLTASPRKRAERRFLEMNAAGITLEQLEQEIRERDRKDQERDVSPLIQAQDAVMLDSTDMSASEVADAILSLCSSRISGG